MHLKLFYDSRAKVRLDKTIEYIIEKKPTELYINLFEPNFRLEDLYVILFCLPSTVKSVSFRPNQLYRLYDNFINFFYCLPNHLESLNLGETIEYIIDPEVLIEAIQQLPHNLKHLDLSLNPALCRLYDKERRALKANKKREAPLANEKQPPENQQSLPKPSFYYQQEPLSKAELAQLAQTGQDNLIRLLNALPKGLVSLRLSDTLVSSLPNMGKVFLAISPQISTLDLSQNNFNSYIKKHGLEKFCEDLSGLSKNLSSLNISWNFYEQPVEAQVAVLKVLPQDLTDLDWSRNNLAQLPPQDLATVFAHLPANLRSIKLSYYRFSMDQLQAIYEPLSKSKITKMIFTAEEPCEQPENWRELYAILHKNSKAWAKQEEGLIIYPEDKIGGISTLKFVGGKELFEENENLRDKPLAKAPKKQENTYEAEKEEEARPGFGIAFG